MSRLIDADKIEMPIFESKTDEIWMKVALDSAPTIDAVSVVRCKDCKNREKYPCDEIEFYECSHLRLYGTKCGVTDDWFCADGERKGE